MSDDNKPEWVVNSIGELGVKIGNRFFFLYKGGSLEYDMKDEPMKWRPVYKREFGEVCHPENYSRAADGVYSFGDDWKDIPASRKIKMSELPKPCCPKCSSVKSTFGHRDSGWYSCGDCRIMFRTPIDEAPDPNSMTILELLDELATFVPEVETYETFKEIRTRLNPDDPKWHLRSRAEEKARTKPKGPQCKTCFRRSSELLEGSDFIECRECGKVVKDRYGLKEAQLLAVFSQFDSPGTRRDKLNALHTYTLNSVAVFKKGIESLKEQVEVLAGKLVEETLQKPKCPDCYPEKSDEQGEMPICKKCGSNDNVRQSGQAGDYFYCTVCEETLLQRTLRDQCKEPYEENPS